MHNVLTLALVKLNQATDMFCICDNAVILVIISEVQ